MSSIKKKKKKKGKKMMKIVIASIAAMALSTVAMAEVNGKVCASCHGQHFEKKAFGISNVVQGLPA